MEEYYEEVANGQNEEEGTAYFFWKTNQLHKYFHLLAQHRRDSAFFKVLANIPLKIAFRTVQKWSI